MTTASVVRSIGKAIRTGWILAGVTCLVLVGIEILSGFVLDRMKPARPGPPDWVQAYGNQDWMREYETEFRTAAKTAWEPYVYWRTLPFAGKTINVGGDGRRRTWAGPASRPSTPRVWVLGGSTVWGICARDDGTVPSHLARILSERNRAADVSNWGEFGYVSTQEVALLARLLREGGRPAAVVFYDGVNDAFSAFQNKQAGLPQNEANRRREFEARQRGFGQILAEQVLTSRTNRLVQRLVGRQPETGEAALAPELEASLARGVADAWFANVEMVVALGKEYGFVPFFFWQPAIFDKLPLTPFETLCHQRHAYLATLFLACTAAVRAHTIPAGGRFVDLSRIFAAEPDGVFVDFCHLTEDGNRRIAEAIAAELDRALDQWR